MSKRIDGYLSRLAQELWAGALVFCETGLHPDGAEWEDWWLERVVPDGQASPDPVAPKGITQRLGLGCKFTEAKQALKMLGEAERVKRGKG